MASHHWLNISIQAPRLVLPILVTIVVSAEANASFTVAMLVIGIINIIPAHLSTVLFALAPGDEVALHREVRKTMRICLMLAMASAPFFVAFSHFILELFGSSYRSATAAMIILGLTTYPTAVKTHYVAICRVRGKMNQAGTRTLLGACLEVGLAAVGGHIEHGATGVAAGYLAAILVELAIYRPVVFGVLRGGGGSRPDACECQSQPQGHSVTGNGRSDD
jgi:Na+-driven multidrug efflux pump